MTIRLEEAADAAGIRFRLGILVGTARWRGVLWFKLEAQKNTVMLLAISTGPTVDPYITEKVVPLIHPNTASDMRYSNDRI